MDGLLGVAGMIINSYLLWIIPENSLRLAPVSKWHEHTHLNQAKMRQAHIKTTIENGVVKPSLEPSCGVLENQSPTHLRPTPTAAPNFGSFTEHRDHLARRGHDAWGWVILIIDVFWRFLMFYSFSPLLDVVILGVHDHLLYAKYESCKKPWYSLLAGETHLSNHNLVARLQHGLGRPVSFADKCRP